MNKKKLVIGLATVLLVLLAVVAVIEVVQYWNDIHAINANPTRKPTKESAGVNDGGEYSVRVDTIYGSLYYQDQWVDYMTVEQSLEDGVLTVEFQARLDAKCYPLFTIVVGEQNGYSVGQITAEDGTKRGVSVAMLELGDLSGLSEGEIDRLYAMQEEINFVITNLK